MDGGADADIFFFEAGDGVDKIRGFEDGLDTLEFAGLQFDDLKIQADKAGNTVVRYGEDDVVRLDIARGLISEDDFVFSLA